MGILPANKFVRCDVMIAQGILSLNFLNMSSSKIEVLKQLCQLLQNADAPKSCYSGYFTNCEISNHMHVFDLLRFTDGSILCIQLINSDDNTNQEQDIDCLLAKTAFYLKHLQNTVFCYCYRLNDGLYKFNQSTNTAERVGADTLINDMLLQSDALQYTIDADSLFAHYKFLVSPFNNIDKFARGEYFLTSQQQTIANDILLKINDNQFFTYFINGGSGCGKSTLGYHIVKQLIAQNENVLIIHNGVFSDAILRFKLQHGFDICSAKEMAITLQCLKIKQTQCNAVFIDNAHTFAKGQINLVCNFCFENKIPLIFTCNNNDYEKIYNNLIANYQELNVCSRNLELPLRYSEEVKNYIKQFLKSVNENDSCDCLIDLSKYAINREDAKNVIKQFELNGYKIINLCYNNSNNPKKRAIKAGFIEGNEYERAIVAINAEFNSSGFKIITDSDKQFLKQLYKMLATVRNKLKIIAY